MELSLNGRTHWLSSALRVRFDRPPDSTNFQQKHRREFSLLSPVGYGTGAEHDPQRESVVHSEFESLGND